MKTQLVEPASARDSAPEDSLGSGGAGILLLHIHRARNGNGTWAAVHDWASTMTRRPIIGDPGVASLYLGAPAVAYALDTADQPGYAAALETLDSHIASITRYRLRLGHERIDRARLPALREYDLISGLTGLGVYLMHRDREPDLLREVVAYLVRLTEPVHASGDELPGWWCGDGRSDRPAQRWDGGHGNLGLAHGIAGPLALLASAMRRGITVTGHTEAISTICRCLDQWCVGHGTGAWWPGRLRRSELRTGTVAQPGPQRPSWCYGTPGLARAQQLAALAVHDQRRQRAAEDALVGCVTDESQLARLGDATLCHGWAGLLHVTRRAAAEAGEVSRLAATLPGLRARLDQHLSRHGPPQTSGLLEGQAGVDLVQNVTATDQPRSARPWDACLLVGP